MKARYLTLVLGLGALSAAPLGAQDPGNQFTDGIASFTSSAVISSLYSPTSGTNPVSSSPAVGAAIGGVARSFAGQIQSGAINPGAVGGLLSGNAGVTGEMVSSLTPAGVRAANVERLLGEVRGLLQGEPKPAQVAEAIEAWNDMVTRSTSEGRRGLMSTPEMQAIRSVLSQMSAASRSAARQ